MMRGRSSENPSDDRFLCMDHVWSAYDVTGDVMMNIGAMCVMIHLTKDAMADRNRAYYGGISESNTATQKRTYHPENMT